MCNIRGVKTSIIWGGGGRQIRSKRPTDRAAGSLQIRPQKTDWKACKFHPDALVRIAHDCSEIEVNRCRGSIVEASWKMKVSRAERKQHHRLKAHQYQYQIKRNQFGKARRGQGWRLRSVQVVYSIQHATAAQIPKRTPRKLCEIKSMAHRREKIASPLTESL